MARDNIHYVRGWALFEHERFEDAVAEFRQAAGDDPTDPYSPTMMSNALRVVGRADAAVAAARGGIRRDPNLSAPHLAHGWALLALNRPDDARRSGRDALRCDPQNANAHKLLGVIAGLKEDYKFMLKHAEAALRIDPQDATAAIDRGKALVHLDRVDDAAAALKRALRFHPDDQHLHQTLGWCLLHAGRDAEALPHLREALRLDPMSEAARACFAEAMKSRNWIYRKSLATALWFGRRRTIRQTTLTAIVTAYAIAMAVAAVMKWYSALIGMAALFGVVLAVMIWQQLSTALFDFVLEFDSLGRHLLTPRERFGAWTVTGFVAVAAIALAASLWHPAFLVFAIPTATIAPWLLYGVIIESPAPRRTMRAVFVIPAVAAAEIGFLLIALIEPFGLNEDVFAPPAIMLICLAFFWFVIGGKIINLTRRFRTS